MKITPAQVQEAIRCRITPTPINTVILKADQERQISVTVAYPANRGDGHDEWADADEVEKAAHWWMERSRRVGLKHADGLVGYGTVVESGIHRGPDWVVKAVDGTEQRVCHGDWVMAIRWQDAPWQEIKDGRLNGLSIQGRGRRIRRAMSTGGDG